MKYINYLAGFIVLGITTWIGMIVFDDTPHRPAPPEVNAFDQSVFHLIENSSRDEVCRYIQQHRHQIQFPDDLIHQVLDTGTFLSATCLFRAFPKRYQKALQAQWKHALLQGDVQQVRALTELGVDIRQPVQIMSDQKVPQMATIITGEKTVTRLETRQVQEKKSLSYHSALNANDRILRTLPHHPKTVSALVKDTIYTYDYIHFPQSLTPEARRMMLEGKRVDNIFEDYIILNYTPMQIAVRNHHDDLIELLYHRGGDIFRLTDGTPAIQLIDNEAFVRRLFAEHSELPPPGPAIIRDDLKRFLAGFNPQTADLSYLSMLATYFNAEQILNWMKQHQLLVTGWHRTLSAALSCIPKRPENVLKSVLNDGADLNQQISGEAVSVWLRQQLLPLRGTTPALREDFITRLHLQDQHMYSLDTLIKKILSATGNASGELIFEQYRLHRKPIHRAAINGDIRTLKARLAHNPAVIQQKDDQGKDAVFLLLEYHRMKYLPELPQPEKYINTETNAGETPLIYAAQKLDMPLMKKLIWYGASLKTQRHNCDAVTYVFQHTPALRARKQLRARLKLITNRAMRLPEKDGQYEEMLLLLQKTRQAQALPACQDKEMSRFSQT
ncbi:ankyrin repeat domain-containing protein [Vibrio quintilis]|uniref:Ankyrin repeats (3 copies) n=1 Tax=Vibrio quintilis TaxID=1117707 RepID=A0A1M7Z2Y3_9VIBR|nr:ankyrin repeat domain-containing protein [Vibrio quintilis]SHO59319.1 Ankyrin repeats (3 copies) [Vibrio quintilis]